MKGACERFGKESLRIEAGQRGREVGASRGPRPPVGKIM